MTDFSASYQYQTTLAQLLGKLQYDQGLPRVIGISGAQGSGKSTLAKVLVERLLAQGVKAAAVSLDDYYLSTAQRRQLAERVHPLLAQRGVPGTHDIGRAIGDVNAMLAGKPVILPSFDKALDDCLPDKPAQQLDILIVEGWCVGVQPQTGAELAKPVNALEANEDADGQWRRFVNAQLAGQYADYWRSLKPLIWLQAPDWDCVCRWRARQEQQLWQQRGKGMTDNELARFMLPFQRLTLAGLQQLPDLADLTVVLDGEQFMHLK
jgi:D-glycerate 3-kinase